MAFGTLYTVDIASAIKSQEAYKRWVCNQLWFSRVMRNITGSIHYASSK